MVYPVGELSAEVNSAHTRNTGNMHAGKFICNETCVVNTGIYLHSGVASQPVRCRYWVLRKNTHPLQTRPGYVCK